MRDLDRWRELTAEDRRLLVAGFFLLPLVALGVRLAGFERVRGALARFAPGTGKPGDDPGRPHRVARMLEIAGSRGLVRVTCVPQALLTWSILRREGFEAAIRIGVRRDGEALRAHAWVEGLENAEGRFALFDHDFASPGSRPA